MLITQANLDALFISFSKVFETAYYTTAQSIVEGVATRIASNTRDQRYPFTQTLSGAMRKWTGERQMQNIAVDGFVVTNLKWENSVSIERTDIEDDQYAVYSSMLIPNLARHAALLPDLEVAKVFNDNLTGFDSKALFATDHPTDLTGATSGTQSNIIASNPLNATNLAKAQARLMSFVGPDNIPMGSYGDTIFCPPSLKYVADTLANATFYPESKNSVSGTFGAQSNVFQGQFRVIASPYLTDTGDPTTAVWYLCDTRSSVRPALWQDREAPQLVSMVDPANPYVFLQDKFAMGARMRGAAAPGFWFKAVKSTT